MRKLGRLLALLLLTSTTACTAMDDALVRIFGRSMRRQPSFKPYEDMMLPPENSVAFSSGNFTPEFGDRVLNDQPGHAMYVVPDFGTGLTGTANPNADVWSTFDNPMRGDASSLARGEEVYNRVCATCHGEDGYGANAYIVDRWPALVVYNLAGEGAAAFPDSYIYGMIRAGRGTMPAYDYAITHFDRWAVVNYVRQLQQNAGTYTPEPQADREDR